MGAEDWEPFKALAKEYKEKKAARRAAFAEMAEEMGFTKHHNTHYSIELLGYRLDYWPGPKKWRWRDRTFKGDVVDFISSRLRKAEFYHEAYSGSDKLSMKRVNKSLKGKDDVQDN